MPKSYNLYKLGLGVIGLFSLVLLIVVLVQASGAKADNLTQKDAQKVADQLNDYVEDEQTIPESLSAAGINDVPSAVRYEKLSKERYKFCVTYKAESSGFDAASVQEEVISGYYGVDYSDYESSYEESYLYLDSTHKKGENCKTIKPYLYSNSSYYDDYNNDEGSSDSSSETYTDPSTGCVYDPGSSDDAINDYYDCLDKADASSTQ